MLAYAVSGVPVNRTDGPPQGDVILIATKSKKTKRER